MVGKSGAATVSLLALGVASAIAQQPAPGVNADQQVALCKKLEQTLVPAERIGLPTKGARVGSADYVLPAPAGQDRSGAFAPAQPAFCKLLVAIAPVDPAAPDIRVQINLPVDWNGKALQYGGGGFNGVLITGLAPLRDAPPNSPTPLAQGYATYGTDSGHQEEKLPEIQAFALNDEALLNFAYASYKKTRDAAAVLIAAHYGRPPTRVYFFGGSEGGREGLVVAQRFPGDYDGIVSAVPVINWTALQAAGAWRSGTMQRDGGWLSPGKVGRLRSAVVAACDGLDGLADGLVANPGACAKTFDMSSLSCAGNGDSEACLTGKQIGAIRAVRTPFELPYALANGVKSYPAYGYGGEDQPGGMIDWTTGPEAPRVPLPAANRQSRIWYYGGGAMRYFVMRDANADPFSFDPAKHEVRMREISTLMDATDPDLSAFQARGGKLILKENMADYAQSAYAGVEYYNSVAAHMGQ